MTRAWEALRRRQDALTLLLLVLIVVVAASARLWHLWPAETALAFAPDTDEGAYAFSAQLLLQGELPYRDFFATLPPAGLYLFSLVLGIFYRPWGSLEGFLALRYASVVYGLLNIVVVYLIGRRLGGRAAGLLAAAVLAVDGIVIAGDRRAMLEAPMNLFSALAVLAYLRADVGVRSRRWLAAAGALSAVAVLVKSPGVIVPLVLVLATLLRRRWADLPALLSGGVAAGLLLAGPFLILCPGDFLRQVYAFQLVRPPDGVISVGARLAEIWGYPYSWLTMRLGLLGAPIALWLHWRKAAWDGWLLVLGWAAGSLGLMVASRSYWGTYFAQLAVPLAILAGGALAWPATEPRRNRWPALGHAVPAILLLAFAGWSVGHLQVQQGATHTLLTLHHPGYVEFTRYLQSEAEPGDTVLGTDPLFGMLASLPAARNGRYVPDSYGGMLYRNLGLAEMGPADLWAARSLFPHGDADATTAVFHQAPAQADVLATFANARYVILDARARRQWSPATIARIEAACDVVLTIGDAALLRQGRTDR